MNVIKIRGNLIVIELVLSVQVPGNVQRGNMNLTEPDSSQGLTTTALYTDHNRTRSQDGVNRSAGRLIQIHFI